MSIGDLISFSNKPRKSPPKNQNAWIIFLKSFGEYLRKTYPDETFPMITISRNAAGIWNNLEDTNLTKIYFKILAKIAEENWNINFLENYDDHRVQTIVNNEIVAAPPPPFPLERFVHSFSPPSSSSTRAEIDMLDPAEDEPLVNDDDGIGTNESVTIIPQANVIDSVHSEPSSNNDSGINTELFYDGTESPIASGIGIADPLDDDSFLRYYYNLDQTFDLFDF